IIPEERLGSISGGYSQSLTWSPELTSCLEEEYTIKNTQLK
ncbi:1634_t:CDS:2, partial [Racocetra persica]